MISAGKRKTRYGLDEAAMPGGLPRRRRRANLATSLVMPKPDRECVSAFRRHANPSAIRDRRR